jgi:hypothetical protein
MGFTVKEQLIRQMVNVLQAIPWVVNVQRLTQGGAKFADVPFIMVTQGDDLVEAVQTRPYTTRRVEVLASIITRQVDPDDLRSSDEILNGYGGDVEAALMKDLTVNGFAVEIKPPDWMEVEIESQVPHIGLALRFGVVYRHLRGDPYQGE